MARSEVRLTYRVQGPTGDRLVTYRAFDQISVEDCMTMLVAACLHRHATGEDVALPVSREIKDALIKQNLVI